MFCSKCGSKVGENEVFCTQCGEKVVMGNTVNVSGATSEESISRKEKSTDSQKRVYEQNMYNDKNSTKFKNRNQGAFLRVLGIGVAVIIFVIIAVLFSRRNVVADTKNIVFEQYGTMEVGEAADRYLEKVDWESEKIAEDEYSVMLNAFSAEIGMMFSIEFRVTYVDDMVYANVLSVHSAGEEYTDDMSIWEIMSIVYGQSIDEADEAYWESYWEY